MTFETLTADFFGFANALSAQEQQALTTLRAFLEEHVAPRADADWQAGRFPHDLLPGLHDTGVCSFAWEHTRPFANSAVFRGFVALELARVDAGISTYVAVQNGLAMGSIDACGSEAQRAEWLPRLARGEAVGAFALTEPESGSDAARGLRTSAVRHGDTWVLEGRKRWIGNATFSDITVVWAKDAADGQVKGFLVPTDSPGYTATAIGAKQALRTVQNADITLEGVAVSDDLRLPGAERFADTARVLRLTRAEVAWSAIGIAIGAWEAARRYALDREQFGRPLAANQLVQDLLVRGLGNITAAIGLCARVSTMLDEGTQRDEHSALAKTYATERMRETVAWCRELCGGNGIVLDYGVMRPFVDAEALYSYEGTRQINTLIVGRAVTGHGAFV